MKRKFSELTNYEQLLAEQRNWHGDYDSLIMYSSIENTNFKNYVGYVLGLDKNGHLTFIPNGSGGDNDYNNLINKPKINGIEIIGNKEPHNYNIASVDDIIDINRRMDLKANQVETDTSIGIGENNGSSTIKKGLTIELDSNNEIITKAIISGSNIQLVNEKQLDKAINQINQNKPWHIDFILITSGSISDFDFLTIPITTILQYSSYFNIGTTTYFRYNSMKFPAIIISYDDTNTYWQVFKGVPII